VWEERGGGNNDRGVMDGGNKNGGPESTHQAGRRETGRESNEWCPPEGRAIWASRPLMAARLIGGGCACVPRSGVCACEGGGACLAGTRLRESIPCFCGS